MKTPLSDRIKRLRTENGLSQKQFAEALGEGFSQATVSKYELGDMEPPLDRLVRIADFGQVSVDWLLGRSEDRGEDVPAIDRTGLDYGAICVLQEIADNAKSEQDYSFVDSINKVLKSPHLKNFLFCVNEVDYTASTCAAQFDPQRKKRTGGALESPGISNEAIREVEERLEDIALSWGYPVSVVANPATVIQIKINEVASAAREIANGIAEIWTRDYLEMLKKCKQNGLEESKCRGQELTQSGGADNGNDRTSEK